MILKYKSFIESITYKVDKQISWEDYYDDINEILQNAATEYDLRVGDKSGIKAKDNRSFIRKMYDKIVGNNQNDNKYLSFSFKNNSEDNQPFVGDMISVVERLSYYHPNDLSICIRGEARDLGLFLDVPEVCWSIGRDTLSVEEKFNKYCEKYPEFSVKECAFNISNAIPGTFKDDRE